MSITEPTPSGLAGSRRVAEEINLGRLVSAVADEDPERSAIIHRDRVTTYRQLVDRSRRLARFLNNRGIGHHTDRSRLQGHESGQHLLAQYLHNGPEYVEGLVGSYLGRVAPFNVNYRYRTDELRYLLKDAAPAVIQYHATFAPMLETVLPELAGVRALLQVADESRNPLLRGAIDYEQALTATPPQDETMASPDDLYVIYTGGTTGMPKGVLWRQGDVAVATLGLINQRANREWTSIAECVDHVRPRPVRVLPCAPMMHGAAQWAALSAVCQGNTVVFPDNTTGFAAGQVLSAVQRHRVNAITLVGDAFGWPLVDELTNTHHDVSSLQAIVSGGAALHAKCKTRLLELVPGLRVVENVGSSESGVLGSQRSSRGDTAEDLVFDPDGSTLVVSEDLSRILEPGHAGAGWLARQGRIPLGYLGDADKTARTFPVLDTVRISVPGDRAQLLADGRVQLLGRDSLTINTGGEKVFVGEVETVLKDHPDVVDAVVCGRPSPRWGSEVAAVVVAPRITDEAALLEHCHASLANYKVPKLIQLVDDIARTAVGKPDYQWITSVLQQGHNQDRVARLKEGSS